MRLVITGAGGFVGGALAYLAPRSWEVHALTRGKCLLEREGLTWHYFDLREESHLRQTIQKIAPDVIIHAAALADIDKCETHRDEAVQINIEVTQSIAHVASEENIRLIFLSTDNVFDGMNAPYVEESLPSPINFYGWTKVRAEEIVRNIVGDHVIARVALVYGFPLLGSGHSAMNRILTTLQANKPLGASPNEFRTPIDVITLSEALLELAQHSFCGTVHLSGIERIDRFSMLQLVAEQLGFSKELVHSVDSSQLSNRAPRPVDVSLANSLACKLLTTSMLTVKEGLNKILIFRSLYQNSVDVQIV